MKYWQGRCPLTSLTDRALLRATRIKPWRDCTTDQERVHVPNGILLSALWDPSVDHGLVSFDNDGSPIFSEYLGDTSCRAPKYTGPVSLSDSHRFYLD